MKSEIIKIGSVGVDSGQLIICDPCYIESQFKSPDSEGKYDHAHEIYRHADGKLWQYCNGEISAYSNVNPFPGSYEDIISEYGLNPNTLKRQGLFKVTDIDPTPHITLGEFSYRGICKVNSLHGGQLNYLMGHPGVAVAVRSGLGDGHYDVFAEIIHLKDWGKRVKKVWVEFITDEEISEL